MNPYLIKDILQLVLGESAALHVFHRAQLFGHFLSVLLSNWCHFLFGQLLLDTGLVPQIGLSTDDQAWHAWAVMVYFLEPFLAHVFKGGGGGDGKANEEDVGLWVRQRTQSVIVFLTGRIEKSKRVWLIANPGFAWSAVVILTKEK